jgi:UrcA family protein
MEELNVMSRFLQMRVAVPCVLLSILVGSSSAVAAVTAPTDDPPTRKVYFGDLDLTRSTGVETLYSRISTAAREVCKTYDGWEPKLFAHSYECRQQALARAVSDINSVTLTNYHIAKTGLPAHKDTASR